MNQFNVTKKHAKPWVPKSLKGIATCVDESPWGWSWSRLSHSVQVGAPHAGPPGSDLLWALHLATSAPENGLRTADLLRNNGITRA